MRNAYVNNVLNTIKLNSGGYSEEIDMLKGYAILFVLINHSMPLFLKKLVIFDLWGGMGVPLFLLIQVFHYYKRGLDNTPQINFLKIFKRVILPFVWAESCIIILKSVMGESPIGSIIGCFTSWGYGPGEYYIWIYLQFVLLLPLTTTIFQRLNHKYIAMLFITISVALEIMCSISNIEEHTYKFLFFRYFFLIYLGYMWAIYDIKLNRKYVVLSIVSIIFILVFDYSGISLTPLIYDSSWTCYHWISYFYPFALFPILLRGIYGMLGNRLQNVLVQMGKYSWQIFCLQLVVFSFMSTSVFAFIDSEVIRGVLYMGSSILMSIFPVLMFKKMANCQIKL